MKKAIAVALSAGLLAGAMIGPADAAKKKKKPKPPVKVERVVEVAYDKPGIGVAIAGGNGGYGLSFPAAAAVPSMPEEKYVSVEITDASGQKVALSLSGGDTDGDGFADTFASLCGATEEPIELPEDGAGIADMYAHNGTCEDNSPSIMTSGVVKLTFSNLP